MVITKEEKQSAIDKFGDHPKDTGKAEVQIAILTRDVALLTEHLKLNKKDHHSKRGLFQKVSKRKGLVGYLKKKDINRYREIISALGLRK
jgi:small subunit ribosomal protein S15